MNRKKAAKLLYLLSMIAASLLLLGLVLSQFVSHEDINADYTVRGKYDVKLLNLNSISSLESVMNERKYSSSLSYIERLDSLLSYRFYHGTCRYNINENWIAYLAGEYIWDDLRMVVKAGDLMKSKVLVCNQMCIVFQQILRNNDITFRTAGVNHHQLTEVLIDDKWLALDPDYEPEFRVRTNLKELIESGRFVELYRNTPGDKFNPHFEQMLRSKNISYSEKNATLAGNLRMFHHITYFLSFFGWILFLALAFLFKRLS